MRDRFDRWIRSKLFTQAVYQRPGLVDWLNRVLYNTIYLDDVLYGKLYRSLMRLAHRLDWHYAPVHGPIMGDQTQPWMMQRWCQWCGFRESFPYLLNGMKVYSLPQDSTEQWAVRQEKRRDDSSPFQLD